MIPAVVELSGLAHDRPDLVGGKAHRLARLLRAGFPVAPGFCLTTAVTATWCDAGREALLRAYRDLGSGNVAVRSSALEEDGDAASFAGVFCSVLPVADEQALLEAVERCLASLHSERARRYRNGLGAGAAPAMAVLVQRLVDARAAGVAYTRSPLDPRRRQIHLNAVWGLAEPLAAGHVAADSFILTPRGRLVEAQVADKPRRLGADGWQGNPSSLRIAPCLTEEEARQVARLALEAEKFFGRPQDVEFALDGDGAWLMQSRPIAAPSRTGRDAAAYLKRAARRLSARCTEMRARGQVSGSDIVFSNGNIGELLPTPTPMSFGLFQRIFAGRHGAIVAGRRRLGYRFDPSCADRLFELIAGQPYFNLEMDAATFDYGASPPVQIYLDRVAADPALANYPEVNLYCRPDPAADAERREVVLAFREGMVRQARAIVEGADGGEDLVAQKPRSWHGLSATEVVVQIGKQVHHLRTRACVGFVVAARLGFHFAALLHTGLGTLFGKEGEVLCARLLSGLPGSLVTQQGLWLEQVAHGERDRAEFLRAYGHTARNELELAEPRLAETPGRLEDLVRDLQASGRSPAADFSRQCALRTAAEGELEARLEQGGVPLPQRRELLEAMELAQRLLPLRETLKHRYTLHHAEIRRGLLYLSGLLGWEADLVFHLKPGELLQALRDSRRFLRLARARREERELTRQAAALLPDVIFASRLDVLGQVHGPAAGGVLSGTGLSPGVACGVARVLDGNALDGQIFHCDEILVVRSANLGLAPLLRMVAGLVVEVGGLLAHGACQAREAGIPALVLPEATRLIRDGSCLRLDGARGTVALIEERKTEMRHDLDLAAV